MIMIGTKSTHWCYISPNFVKCVWNMIAFVIIFCQRSATNHSLKLCSWGCIAHHTSSVTTKHTGIFLKWTYLYVYKSAIDKMGANRCINWLRHSNTGQLLKTIQKELREGLNLRRSVEQTRNDCSVSRWVLPATICSIQSLTLIMHYRFDARNVNERSVCRFELNPLFISIL